MVAISGMASTLGTGRLRVVKTNRQGSVRLDQRARYSVATTAPENRRADVCWALFVFRRAPLFCGRLEDNVVRKGER
jgi:hypothetical protein